MDRKINPRLLELALRQKNPNFLEEETRREAEKGEKSKSNFESSETNDDDPIVFSRKTIDGKPNLNLNYIINIAVHTPTQLEYDVLMRVYECGGLMWPNENYPTKRNYFGRYNETCIKAGIEYLDFGPSGDFKKQGFEILTSEEFYDSQDVTITPEMISEINEWFDENEQKN